MKPRPIVSGHHREPLKPEERQRLEAAYFDMRQRRAGAPTARRSVVTTDVRIKAMEFSRGNPDASRVVNSIARFVKNTEMVDVSPRVLQHFYNAQTAHDVVTKRAVPTLMGTSSKPIIGCQTISATMAALLRAVDPQRVKGSTSDVRIVRTRTEWGRDDRGRILGMPHTLVSFKVNGRQHYADALKGSQFLGGRAVISEADLNPKIRQRIAQLKSQGDWREADDVSEFGTNTFAQFLEECHRSGADIARRPNLADFLVK